MVTFKKVSKDPLSKNSVRIIIGVATSNRKCRIVIGIQLALKRVTACKIETGRVKKRKKKKMMTKKKWKKKTTIAIVDFLAYRTLKL